MLNKVALNGSLYLTHVILEEIGNMRSTAKCIYTLPDTTFFLLLRNGRSKLFLFSLNLSFNSCVSQASLSSKFSSTVEPFSRVFSSLFRHGFVFLNDISVYLEWNIFLVVKGISGLFHYIFHLFLSDLHPYSQYPEWEIVTVLRNLDYL